MSGVEAIANVVVRQAAGTAAATLAAASTAKPACSPDNDYDGRIGLRISSIFVILVGSMFGACFPVYAGRHMGVGVPEWAFFIAKYFGSGVIIATAFIHLLAPACDALTNPCLTGPITLYDWAEGIALMTIFILFFVELMAMRFATFGHNHNTDEEHDHSTHEHVPQKRASRSSSNGQRHTPGEDHLGHTRDHIQLDDEPHDTEMSTVATTGLQTHEIEDYAAQMTAIFILEFGLIFHSIFVGLTLAVAGAEFNVLYVVLVFHQTFEGLGLGSRLAATPWPKSKQWTPYYLALGYGLSTPISIAAGLGVRTSYAPESQKSLVVNGVFDSISAGILIYTGLVELMAHEFMFSSYMRSAPLKVVLNAFGIMCLGAGLMALLGRWA